MIDIDFEVNWGDFERVMGEGVADLAQIRKFSRQKNLGQGVQIPIELNEFLKQCVEEYIPNSRPLFQYFRPQFTGIRVFQ